MNIKYIALGTLLLAGVASAQTGYYSDGKYTIERHMTDTDGDGIYDTNHYHIQEHDTAALDEERSYYLEDYGRITDDDPYIWTGDRGADYYESLYDHNLYQEDYLEMRNRNRRMMQNRRY
ncbi:MAG TPA: hypothetical protein EYO33_13545 [Phycisphaerales bacterium]|nr:hypothetical protein [Phycisphaerales bacterium]|tara:strand:- start:129 stop:488 length:360 start_codon:yes stop_codon:yes gene_type:complete